MSPLSSANPGTSQMDDQLNINVFETHVVSVPRIDRWRIYYRLQELMIPCWCLPDGSLRVKVQSGMGVLLLRSVVQQFVASRQEMVNWLERCWVADRFE
ncbi:Asr1405/Asl0597 family protein [Leptothermofonsia sichuanensis]|uniref:Asr1405/Asl0597 family protein n=1 Tax=Leptothermofonsia sichuanensis TaxID=2917832 RepID=UPI001EF15600